MFADRDETAYIVLNELSSKSSRKNVQSKVRITEK